MNAPSFTRKSIALANASERVAKAQHCIILLQRYQECTLEGVTSQASRFWELVSQYQLATAMSDLFGVDTFGEMSDNAAYELRSEHSYDIDEEVMLDREGDPAGSWCAGRVM